MKCKPARPAELDLNGTVIINEHPEEDYHKNSKWRNEGNVSVLNEHTSQKIIVDLISKTVSRMAMSRN